MTQPQPRRPTLSRGGKSHRDQHRTMVHRHARKSNDLSRIRRVLARARRRYNRLPVTERPGPQAPNLAGLFTQAELWALWRAKRWPLSPRDLQYVTGKPRRPRSPRPPLRYVVLGIRVIVEGW